MTQPVQQPTLTDADWTILYNELSDAANGIVAWGPEIHQVATPKIRLARALAVVERHLQENNGPVTDQNGRNRVETACYNLEYRRNQGGGTQPVQLNPNPPAGPVVTQTQPAAHANPAAPTPVVHAPAHVAHPAGHQQAPSRGWLCRLLIREDAPHGDNHGEHQERSAWSKFWWTGK